MSITQTHIVHESINTATNTRMQFHKHPHTCPYFFCVHSVKACARDKREREQGGCACTRNFKIKFRKPESELLHTPPSSFLELIRGALRRAGRADKTQTKRQNEIKQRPSAFLPPPLPRSNSEGFTKSCELASFLIPSAAIHHWEQEKKYRTAQVRRWPVPFLLLENRGV